MERPRSLRNRPTASESRLWQALRRKALGGARFRRQQPIGRYVVDFFCPEKKLIVEVDGKGHCGNRLHDETRDQFLARSGYHVLRFWNDEISKDLPGVLSSIRKNL
jgi:very-short-patch-repair endonuclease